MSKKIIEIRVCDLCGEQVDSFAKATENDGQVVTKLTYSTWYGSDKTPEICQSCGKKLMHLLDKEFPKHI